MLVNGISIDTISITDRALSYGDGVFETVLLHEGYTIYLERHLERLFSGCKRLGITCDEELLNKEIEELSSQFLQYGILKIIVSRETGGRGYRPDSSVMANRILTLHALPDYKLFPTETGIQTFLCQQRLALQPVLAGIKHLNRLEQVLASQEWPGEEFLEGIMLDVDGRVIEGTKSNLFFVESGNLVTPALTCCGVEGVMRNALIAGFKNQVKVEQVTLTRVFEADEVFVCNSIFGVWPVLSLKTAANVYCYSPGDFYLQARQIFESALTQHAS